MDSDVCKECSLGSRLVDGRCVPCRENVPHCFKCKETEDGISKCDVCDEAIAGKDNDGKCSKCKSPWKQDPKDPLKC